MSNTATHNTERAARDASSEVSQVADALVAAVAAAKEGA